MKMAASDTLPTWPNLTVTGVGVALGAAAALAASDGEGEGDAALPHATSVRTVATAIAESVFIVSPLRFRAECTRRDAQDCARILFIDPLAVRRRKADRVEIRDRL